MSFYTNKRIWKLFLLIGAVAIGSFTLYYTHHLTAQLKTEERKRVELWVKAISELTDTQSNNQSLELTLEVVTQNTTIPVIIVDADSNIIQHRNIHLPENNSETALKEELNRFVHARDPFIINLGDGELQYLYYDDSILIKKLEWFPIIQLSVVALFIIIAYVAFSGARKAEQDQVWVGMSKETAHQLGTPTSSLLGWVDVLKLKNPDSEIADELSKDVERLQVITDRFSKIGSKPELKAIPLMPVIEEIVSYLDRRTASNVTFNIVSDSAPYIMVNINKVLFQWVLENLCKNGVDAIKGDGTIQIAFCEEDHQVAIDISDSGKGLLRKQFKAVFKPGYTTKLRGWGLGLSLAKRIIEGYHGGKIFVKESELGKGTTFRILLPVSA